MARKLKEIPKLNMATQKEFVDGKPAPVIPPSEKDKKGNNALSENPDQDYDENEHSDDIAAFKKETGLDQEPKTGAGNK